MAREQDSLRWSSQFSVAPPQRTPKLSGDKIILPHSALEQLLAAAPLSEAPSQGPSRLYTNTFDPFNPHTFAAESQARARNVDHQKQLPHPLTFRLVNPQNGRAIYAGIREFSAEEQQIGLSAFLRRALGIDDDQPSSQTNGQVTESGQSMEVEDAEKADTTVTITVHAKQLPKGTYVRLRPLEAGYDPEDWKALLERHLRDNFTTLTTGELLTVAGGRDEIFRFLVDRVEPEGDGICVVDTDLEVDIVALTEDQARETLQKRLEKASRAPGTQGGSSIGGALRLGETATGQVIPEDYVDYELKDWDRAEPIEVELEGADDADVYLFASPFSARQRNRPRADEHVFADFSARPSKRLRIQPSNIELDGAESLYLSVHAFAQTRSDEEQRPGAHQSLPLQYNLRVVQGPSTSEGDINTEEKPEAHDAGDVQCKNCHQWIPQRTLVLHENFCLRNNVLCPQCRNVFQKRSPEWHDHWHCPHDSSYGNDASSKNRHDTIFHTQCSCPACELEVDGLPRLAQHRTTDCPAKPILCQFCHLVVPQKGDLDPDIHDPEVLLSGLTPHELVDGGRTTECHLCNKIIRLRDMKTHLRHHDLERLSRPAPRICLNQNCGRTLDARGVQSAITPGTDTLGLCSICFGPLYVDTYDPEGKTLRRRIERRYLSQLMTGCGKSWCQNEYCKTGKQQREPPGTSNDGPASMSAAAILTLVRPLIDALNLRRDTPNTAPLYLCTDQVGQQRRILAEMIAAEGTATGGKAYDFPWCVAAVEATAGSVDNAREWLANWAPARGEDKRRVH
ncbi:putative ubiquitin fusion degradation protein (Ufd1) [Aspergillus clavatus NRRL 1]|uniref:Ubiquitin fusion degradation protein (Ufd1), putative n=1 Tax=Aspergillus clavatus (strain ATCC 1007 / CBS 513.65 / DSM 816 / NCTC 3887 / NRRL 1 / QM 1276 / 107) TaxID=344612 RepID=A1C901_ASPCL|nr:ubiquitin fusion degradation protein (Ufd1), putative [Aspergillus clavatus NRRL 1]EAW13325.1 ubiquitin fusion degradation protein (Ufd1), putative [Aspergillus clavatus NRRL 1]